MKTDPEKALAQHMREKREEAGLSQQDVADQAGVCQAVVSHWESGRGTRSLRRALRVAAVLKLRPADVV